MSANRSDHYSTAQIALHWGIVLLVIVQLISHEGMEQVFDRLENDPAGAFDWSGMALLHAVSGATVLVLMTVRVLLRTRLGAPALPADLPAWQKSAARASHYALYGLLLLLPMTGASAVLLRNGALGGLHGLLVTLLWLVLAFHVAAALYHGLVRRDGVVSRILVPRG
jgi:cytochrome b561